MWTYEFGVHYVGVAVFVGELEVLNDLHFVVALAKLLLDTVIIKQL